eukprot:4065970-Pyramimonas_sp.AAC.1
MTIQWGYLTPVATSQAFTVVSSETEYKVRSPVTAMVTVTVTVTQSQPWSHHGVTGTLERLRQKSLRALIYLFVSMVRTSRVVSTNIYKR